MRYSIPRLRRAFSWASSIAVPILPLWADVPVGAAAAASSIPPSVAPAAIPPAARQSIGEVTLAELRRWQKANAESRDRISVELQQRFEKENGEQIVRALPAERELLETPVAISALGRWALEDPLAAIRWVEALPGPRDVHARIVLNSWADRHPEAVTRYLAGLKAGEWKNGVLDLLARRWQESGDLARSVACLAELPPAKRPHELLVGVATDWGRTDFARAAKWAGEQPAEALQAELLSAVAIGYASRNPADAIAFLQSAVPAGPTSATAAATIVSMWAERDPRSAMETVIRLPPGSVRERASDALVNAWADSYHDAQMAKAWILSLPPGAERNRLFGRLVATRAIENPAEAATWTTQHLEPGRARDEAFALVLREWLAADLEGARAWIASIPDPSLRGWAESLFLTVKRQRETSANA